MKLMMKYNQNKSKNLKILTYNTNNLPWKRNKIKYLESMLIKNDIIFLQ